jgi:predicted transposase/invertase (TIGR01784 family)
LIRQTEKEAPAAARELIVRVKNEIGDEALRADLIELIGTVIIYKLPRLSREEIEKMLDIHDIRKSRVFQEGKMEGEKEGKKEGKEEGISIAIEKMASKKFSAEEIAGILELDMDMVRQAIAKANGK